MLTGYSSKITVDKKNGKLINKNNNPKFLYLKIGFINKT